MAVLGKRRCQRLVRNADRGGDFGRIGIGFVAVVLDWVGVDFPGEAISCHQQAVAIHDPATGEILCLGGGFDGAYGAEDLPVHHTNQDCQRKDRKKADQEPDAVRAQRETRFERVLLLGSAWVSGVSGAAVSLPKCVQRVSLRILAAWLRVKN